MGIGSDGSQGHQGRYAQNVLDLIDPVFEKQIFSMIFFKHSRRTRCCEEVWESMTEAANRAGLKLSLDKEQM